MKLDKRESETELQYHKRLVEGKLVDKTLSEVDYTELSELVYGKQYSSDVARRMMYGSQKTLELISDELVNHSSELDDTELRILELKKEQKKFSDQRREYYKLVADDARAEHIESVIKESARSIVDERVKIYECVETNGIPKNKAVLVYSDWHYGMDTKNIYNEFNTDICINRIRNVTLNAIDRITLHNCDELYVVCLGDIAHGHIHTSARVASEELVADQIMHASEILAQSILELSKYVEKTHVLATYGNHLRTVPNKKDNVHRDNLERLVRWWLEARLAPYEDIEVCKESDTEFLLFDVCGHGFSASHGDLDGVKSSPRALHTLFSKTLGVDVEYILLGDKHHRESFNELGITSFICGSLCGSDDYASDRRLFSDPSQMLLIVNDKYGVDAEYRLSCE